jgi:hypothetical protein
MGFHEQRSHDRKILAADALIEDGSGHDWRHVHMLDVSRMGLAFTTDEIVEVGSIRRFDFALPGSLTRIVCRARIANRLVNAWPEHKSESAFRVGAMFEAIDPQHVEMIERFVQEEADSAPAAETGGA